jgi:hypothetical protein
VRGGVTRGFRGMWPRERGCDSGCDRIGGLTRVQPEAESGDVVGVVRGAG